MVNITERFCLFPLTEEIRPLIEYRDLSFLNLSCVAGLPSQRHEIINELKDYSIPICCPPSQYLEKYDTLLIPTIGSAVHTNATLMRREVEQVKLAAKSVMSIEDAIHIYRFSSTSSEVIDHCSDNIPVITVFKQLSQIDSLSYSLEILRILKRLGYNVILLTGSHLGMLFQGVYSFPDCISNSDITSANKLMELRKHLAILSLKYAPDIYIVEMPGSIFDYDINDEIPVLWTEIATALSPDYQILLTLCDEFQDLRQPLCHYAIKIGGLIDSVIMTNAHLDGNSMRTLDKQKFMKVSSETVNRVAKKYANLVYTKDRMEELCSKIVSSLSCQGENYRKVTL
jgi:hypothetical protein